MRLELAPLLGQPPVLEKAVHVDVGEPARPPTQRVARCFPTTPMASGAAPRNWFREQDLSGPNLSIGSDQFRSAQSACIPHSSSSGSLMTAGSSGSVSLSSSSSSSSSSGSRGGGMLPMMRARLQSSMEKVSGIHWVMSAPCCTRDAPIRAVSPFPLGPPDSPPERFYLCQRQSVPHHNPDHPAPKPSVRVHAVDAPDDLSR